MPVTLELAREIVSVARNIGIVTDTNDIKAAPQWDEINAAAAKLEITLVGGDARRPEDIDATFRKFSLEHVDVVIVLQANSLILDRANIAAAAAAYRLPTVYGYREHVETGGLVSYGVNLDYCFHRAATYVYKILRGTPVSDRARDGMDEPPQGCMRPRFCPEKGVFFGARPRWRVFPVGGK
jgi:putative tryptophan/tyrosine transport system substrate-binding protein